MNLVSKYSYTELCSQLIGKIVNFKSDCQFFPNFDVTGKVIAIDIAKNNEYLIKLLRNGKVYDIGSNMRNLNFTFPLLVD